jgi:hypothetical protein
MLEGLKIVHYGIRYNITYRGERMFAYFLWLEMVILYAELGNYAPVVSRVAAEVESVDNLKLGNAR